MNAAREDVCQRSVAGRHAAHQKRLRTLLGLLLTATFVLPEANALAQSNPIMPRISIGGEQKGCSPLKNRSGKSRSTQITRRRTARSRLRKRPIPGPMCGRRLLAQDRKLRRLRKTPLRKKRSNRRNNRNNRQVASRGCRVVIGSPADRFRESCIVVRLHGHRIVSASADVVWLSAFAASYSCPHPRTWRNGRRKGLKIPWGKPCAGSSPAVRTNKITAQIVLCEVCSNR